MNANFDPMLRLSVQSLIRAIKKIMVNQMFKNYKRINLYDKNIVDFVVLLRCTIHQFFFTKKMYKAL